MRGHAGHDATVSIPIPDSVTDAELTTVQMIAAAMGEFPAEPACPGPLLIHADGAFECHGENCPGGMAIYHSDDVVEPCLRHPEVRTLHACPRCLTHSDGAALAEHTCTGEQIEHDDGAVECTAGDACLGEQALHLSGRSCRVFGPCPRNCEPVL
ncbi:hypothetical protein GCM10007977_025280 [Dactylosporangium sucinum]|uniref:Uncharacterized protein n=2 Tax=Dactylosporangium sucinum TaxID=1424081 RepID=A0A917THN9_9ACTN|nr:hypothetical protein GCM10007977_025280 [Dactylosporangium sucinum]